MQKELAERDQKIKLQGQQIEMLTAQLDTIIKQNATIMSGMQAAIPVNVPPVQQQFAMPPIPAKMPKTRKKDELPLQEEPANGEN